MFAVKPARANSTAMTASRAAAPACKGLVMVPKLGREPAASEATRPSAWRVVGTSKPLQASLNRILANIGTLWIRKIEARQRALDLYKTGLMISRWRAVRVKDAGRNFNTRVAIANDTPYLVYVHAKGTAKSATFLKTELPKITTNISADLTADLYALRSSPAFQRAVKIAILSGSVRA